jgi:ABC-type methionine transport system permease subunit
VIITITSTVVGIADLDPDRAWGRAQHRAACRSISSAAAIVALSRALNEIIVAILLVAIFGFGPLAGFLTLSFATIGFLAKLLAEDIEDMDEVQAEAIRATGASWMQWINYGVQPQVMPRLIGLSMYRLDINFRESAVLGLVGAGGIGATLNTAFDRYEFDTAAAILLIIIGIVMVHRISLRHHQGEGAVMPVSAWRTAPKSGVARPQPDARPLGRLSRGCRRLHVVLAAYPTPPPGSLSGTRRASPPISAAAPGAAALVLHGQFVGSACGTRSTWRHWEPCWRW